MCQLHSPHSMGGSTGIWGVREGEFRPRLLIGAGFPVELREHGPQLLLLAGQFEEILSTSPMTSNNEGLPANISYGH